jgi:hypothetical protein
MGSSVYAWAMLDNVPIWFEIGRQLNRFPPNLLQEGVKKSEDKEANSDKSEKK